MRSLASSADRVSEHRQLAGVGKQDRHDQPDRRGLAGAVRADDAVERAGRDGQIEIVDGGRRSERLADAVQAQRGFKLAP